MTSSYSTRLLTIVLASAATGALVVLLVPSASSAKPKASSQSRTTIDTDPTLTPMQRADNRRRKAVRGCPVGDICRREFRAQLAEFERATFGRTSGPWIEVPDKPKTVTAVAGKTPVLSPRRRDPLNLRPDLPWLAALQLPDLPMRWDHRIIKYLEFYKNDPRGRRIMGTWLRDQGKYRDLLLAYLRNARLPDDLIYVCMIESSYDPHEYSRVGASGLWQFMPASGKIYGLTINRWLDERNDPERSTEAAMMYFADLYHRFGNWELALAAYNAGYGAVLSAVASFHTNDYWQLIEYENALPWGTSFYVPKAIAAAIVGNNRELFGFADVQPEEPLHWDTVNVRQSTTFARLAKAAGTTAEIIAELNPQLRRKRTPPGVSDYPVRVPKGATAKFAKSLRKLAEIDSDNYTTYTVRHGERFEDIAALHGLSRRQLRQLNDIDHESEVIGGTVLVVPRLSEAEQAARKAEARDRVYIAGSPRGREDDKLVVALIDPDLQLPKKKRVFYRVVTGDTLHRVAQAFQVQPRELALWNGLRVDAYLQPRMVLRLFVNPSLQLDKRKLRVLDPDRLVIVARGSAEHLSQLEALRGRERYVYTAKRRESFAEIGRKFGLRARDLARINRRSHATVVEPGDQVIVYRVVDPSRSARAAAQKKAVQRANRKKSRRSNKRKRRPRS